MLMFSREEGDQIVIADRIRVTVLEVSGNRVRLGVSAPGQMAIRRGELDDTERMGGKADKDVAPPIPSVDSVERTGD
jgi:carbon storage regulator